MNACGVTEMCLAACLVCAIMSRHMQVIIAAAQYRMLNVFGIEMKEVERASAAASKKGERLMVQCHGCPHESVPINCGPVLSGVCPVLSCPVLPSSVPSGRLGHNENSLMLNSYK